MRKRVAELSNYTKMSNQFILFPQSPFSHSAFKIFSLIHYFGHIFKVSEKPDQVVVFVWKKKYTTAVPAVSNALMETISNQQHRFALAVPHAFCHLNRG